MIPTAVDINTFLEKSSSDFLVDVLWHQNDFSTFYDADRVVFKTPLDEFYLDLSFNNLTGSIPSELATLLQISTSYINLEGNMFTGTLPNELCPWQCGKNDSANASSALVGSTNLVVDCEQVVCDCNCFQ